MALNYQIATVTASTYTAAAADEVIIVKTVSSPVTITLPTPSSAGRAIYIKDGLGSSLVNPITIKGTAGKFINGVSFAMLNGDYSHIQVVYDGQNWLTI